MALGAVSLRNNQYNTTQTNFGKKTFKNDIDDLKNRKAAGIAISVGMTAATAIALYAFRGKITQLPLFKNTKELGQNLMTKAGNLHNKAKNLASGVGEKVSKIGNDLKSVKKTVGTKVGTLCDKTKELAEQASTKASEIGEETKKFVKNISQKGIETIKTVFEKK